jgi:hypothetical protein
MTKWIVGLQDGFLTIGDSNPPFYLPPRTKDEEHRGYY